MVGFLFGGGSYCFGPASHFACEVRTGSHTPHRKKHFLSKVLFSTKSTLTGGINRIHDEIPLAWDEIRLDGGWVDLISSEAAG